MTDLLDLVPSLQRVVAPPGQFLALYPQATELDMVGLLADGLAEATLDGFFVLAPLTWTDDGVVTPDLQRGQQALVVIYAGDRFLKAEMKNATTTTRYKAGPVEYEVQKGASIISELLRENADRKKQLILQQSEIGVSAAFLMADSYFINAVGPGWGYGSFGYERFGYELNDAQYPQRG